MYLLVKLNSCVVPSLDMLSESDVFCVVRFQGIEKTTCTIHNSNYVEWNDSAMFLYPVKDSMDFRLFVDVYDSDGWTNQHICCTSFEAIESDVWVSVSSEKVTLSYAFVDVFTKNQLIDKIEGEVEKEKKKMKESCIPQ